MFTDHTLHALPLRGVQGQHTVRRRGRTALRDEVGHGTDNQGAQAATHTHAQNDEVGFDPIQYRRQIAGRKGEFGQTAPGGSFITTHNNHIKTKQTKKSCKRRMHAPDFRADL